MLVNIFFDEFGKAVNRFWDYKITNKATADLLVRAVITSLEEHNVPTDNCIQIMSNSANVMRLRKIPEGLCGSK